MPPYFATSGITGSSKVRARAMAISVARETALSSHFPASYRFHNSAISSLNHERSPSKVDKAKRASYIDSTGSSMVYNGPTDGGTSKSGPASKAAEVSYTFKGWKKFCTCGVVLLCSLTTAGFALNLAGLEDHSGINGCNVFLTMRNTSMKYFFRSSLAELAFVLDCCNFPANESLTQMTLSSATSNHSGSLMALSGTPAMCSAKGTKSRIAWAYFCSCLGVAVGAGGGSFFFFGPRLRGPFFTAGTEPGVATGFVV